MNAITTRAPQPVLTPQNFDQLMIFADTVAGSDMVPRDYKGKPANIVVAVQMGMELGLQPMQALNSIAVINGRPGVWGDGLIGLCLQSPLCEDIREWFEGEGDTLTAFCEAKRKGKSPTVGKFSVNDARLAGLWDKAGPWKQYPARMLQNRARGFALRDAFPDLLRGLKTVEELQDYPVREEREVQSTVVSQQRHVPAQQGAAPEPTPARAEMDRTLNSDDLPNFDAPKPDRFRKVADRIKQKLAEAQNQDAYNAVMQHTGIQAEWAKLQADRAELAEEVEAFRAETFARIHAAGAQAEAEDNEIPELDA